MSGSVLDVLYTLRLVHHKSYPIDIYLPHFTDEKNEVPDFSQLFPELYAPRCPGLLLTLCAHRGILHFHLDHSSLINIHPILNGHDFRQAYYLRINTF